MGRRRITSEKHREAALRNLEKARAAQPRKPRGNPPPYPLADVEPGSPLVCRQAMAFARLLAEDGLLEVRSVYVPALEVAAMSYLKARRLHDYLERHHLVNATGELRKEALEMLLRYAREAREALAECGMTPSSRSRLGLQLAATEDAALHLARLRADRATPVDAEATAEAAALPGEVAGASPADPVAVQSDPPAPVQTGAPAAEAPADPAPAPPDEPAERAA